jgi:N-acetylglucosamine-6-phosphate deacetylase
MGLTILRNCNLVSRATAGARSTIVVENGKIREISARAEIPETDQAIDVFGQLLFPGFIDVHNHGAVGHDVNNSTAEELMEVAAFLSKNGVTAWLPTLVPDTDDNYERVIGEIDRLREMQEGKPVAQAVGVHYEGVFANEAMCGALRPEYFKSGQWSAAGGRLPKLKRGVHMTTLAPEVEGGIDLIRELVSDGWIVSIGHTRADVATLNAAFEAGARHLTHFFNAMTGIHHRDLGVAGWGLSNEEMTFDIIADGIHVSPEMLKLACRAKSADKVSLISDSVAPTGLGDGDFEVWGEKVSVVKGRTRNERGSIAGSVITMHDAVKQMMSLGFSPGEVAAMASANPAKLIGLDHQIGTIDVGKRADLVALENDGSIKFVMVSGQMVASQNEV